MPQPSEAPSISAADDHHSLLRRRGRLCSSHTEVQSPAPTCRALSRSSPAHYFLSQKCPRLSHPFISPTSGKLLVILSLKDAFPDVLSLTHLALGGRVEFQSLLSPVPSPAATHCRCVANQLMSDHFRAPRVPCDAVIWKVRALSTPKAIPLTLAPPLCFCSSSRSFFVTLSAQTVRVQTINKLGELHVWNCWAIAVPPPKAMLTSPSGLSSLGSPYTLRTRMGGKGGLISQTVWNGAFSNQGGFLSGVLVSLAGKLSTFRFSHPPPTPQLRGAGEHGIIGSSSLPSATSWLTAVGAKGLAKVTGRESVVSTVEQPPVCCGDLTPALTALSLHTVGGHDGRLLRAWGRTRTTLLWQHPPCAEMTCPDPWSVSSQGTMTSHSHRRRGAHHRNYSGKQWRATEKETFTWPWPTQWRTPLQCRREPFPLSSQTFFFPVQ